MRSFTKLLLLSALLFASNAQAQYCLLPGRTPYSANQPGITNFKLGTINRTSGHVEDMTKVVVVTNDSTVLYTGQTYTVTLTHTRDAAIFPDARNNIRVWIDYNNNKSFLDAGETVISADYDTFGVFTGTFTVPATAPLGTVRLRATAKMSSDAGHSIPTPCDTPVADPIGYHGEMEDYKVRIAAPPTAILETAPRQNLAAIYPNPTTGKVTVTFSNIDAGPIAVDMIDVAGKLIGNLLNTSRQGSLSYTFDLNNYTTATGIYFIKVTTASGATYQKVLKAD